MMWNCLCRWSIIFMKNVVGWGWISYYCTIKQFILQMKLRKANHRFRLSKSPPSTNIHAEDFKRCPVYFSRFSKLRNTAIRLDASLIVWQPTYWAWQLTLRYAINSALDSIFLGLKLIYCRYNAWVKWTSFLYNSESFWSVSNKYH